MTPRHYGATTGATLALAGFWAYQQRIMLNPGLSGTGHPGDATRCPRCTFEVRNQFERYIRPRARADMLLALGRARAGRIQATQPWPADVALAQNPYSGQATTQPWPADVALAQNPYSGQATRRATARLHC